MANGAVAALRTIDVITRNMRSFDRCVDSQCSDHKRQNEKLCMRRRKSEVEEIRKHWFSKMTSAQLSCYTDINSNNQISKYSLVESVNQIFSKPQPLINDDAVDSPLPSIQSWYPSLMTSDASDTMGVRLIAQREPLIYSESAAPSVFLSSATDRNYECVLDMEGQTISDDIQIDLREIKCEREDKDDGHEADGIQKEEIESSLEQFARTVISADLGSILSSGQDFPLENYVANIKKGTSRRKKKMVTTVATQTPPENAIYDDIEPLRLPVRFLYEFLELLLADEKYRRLIAWKNKEERIFMLIDHHRVAEMWGMHKRKKPMTYDKFSRALRFYYSKNILKKEPGRFTYRFLTKEGEIVKFLR